MSEYELLQAFRKGRSEEAFAELVRRYAGLVYSVAKRRLVNASLAEDVMQIVFIRFAKAPPKVASSAHLAAWLHRTTLNVTVDMWRSETRRRNREQQSTVMEPVATEDSVWESVAPNLDEALNRLNDEDRHALLLRFFAEKTMRDVGATLGVSEDAAKMRVSRAVDRLRTQLGVGGAVCTAAILGTILSERSVEAAPIQLVSRLAAMKLPAVAGVNGMIISSAAFLRTFKFSLAGGAVVLAMIVVSIFRLAQSSNEPTPEGVVPNSQTNLTDNTTGIASRKRIGLSGSITPIAPPKTVKMLFHVLDAESGGGLAATTIHVAYFWNAGTEEGRDVVTDTNGVAAISQPEDATKLGAMNVFVVAEGHVPKSVSFQNGVPPDYTMKLESAITAGGWVVDEQGLPVPGVTIMVQKLELRFNPGENRDFQTCPVTNQDDGSWSCSYIPKDYTNEVRFILKKQSYATTLPVVPAGKVDLTNLVLVINRGFTVTGQITDPQNRPIINARIKTLNGDSNQRKSASTDEHGVFSLEGVEDCSLSESPPLQTNENGAVVIRGLAGIGPLHVELAVQAEGFAGQTNTLKLDGVTNFADFTLSLGRIFRGWVVDEAGNAISNAIVQTDWDNQGVRAFDWETRTDSDGHFEWDSAPEGPILFSFEAEGYQWQRDITMQADGTDHEITLERNQ